MKIGMMLRIAQAIKEGVRLNRLLKSRTMREQTIALSVVSTALFAAASYLGTMYPDSIFADSEWTTITIGAIITTIAPLISRLIAFFDEPKKMFTIDPAAWVVRVRKKEETVWRAFNGTILDAYAEKWHEAVTTSGLMYDLRRHKVTGEKRISDREKTQGRKQ